MKISKKKLDIALARAQLTRGALATKAGVSNHAVAAAGKGRDMRPDLIGLIAHALNVDVEDLLEEDDEA